MDIASLHGRLDTKVLGKTILYLPRTGSTNADARKLAERGAAEGTVVIAGYQTAGHGRLGRAWLADADSSLLLSIVLRPPLPPSEAFYLTMVPAMAVLDAAGALDVPGANLKWPNDVHVSGRKVAGILTEVSLRGQDLDYVVAGIGLNVNLDVARYPEIATRAASLRSALGREVALVDVALLLLAAFERRYLGVLEGRTVALFEDWRAALNTIGQWVNVSDGGGSYRAFAEDVTPDGGLVLLRGGQRLVVYGGDVTLSKRG